MRRGQLDAKLGCDRSAVAKLAGIRARVTDEADFSAPPHISKNECSTNLSATKYTFNCEPAF